VHDVKGKECQGRRGRHGRDGKGRGWKERGRPFGFAPPEKIS